MPKIKKSCEECGKIIYRWPSNLNGKKYGSFCTNECIGKFRTKKLVGEFAANYKTGSKKDRAYIVVEAKWHPKCDKKGYIGLHRLLAEAATGRFLNENEIVHHKDDNPRNNHWDNLEIMTYSEHAKHHSFGRIRSKNGQFQNTKGN